MTTDPERPAVEVTKAPEEEEVVTPEPLVPPEPVGPTGREEPARDVGEDDLGLADRQTPDDS
jgi:hypothetical protein